MSQGLRELTNHELNASLESVLLPRLSKLLAARDLGHCMRVTDLDRELMIRLAGGLRAAVPSANVVVLADDSLRAMAPDMAVSVGSARVRIALGGNADAGGGQRRGSSSQSSYWRDDNSSRGRRTFESAMSRSVM